MWRSHRPGYRQRVRTAHGLRKGGTEQAALRTLLQQQRDYRQPEYTSQNARSELAFNVRPVSHTRAAHVRYRRTRRWAGPHLYFQRGYVEERYGCRSDAYPVGHHLDSDGPRRYRRNILRSRNQGYAHITSITVRGGYTQTLQYNGSNQLTSVTDTYNRSLQLTYSNGLLNAVTTPDGLVLTYGYNSSGVSPGVLDRLASITYSTTPISKQSFLYENSALPFALTGIIDEDSNRYATWTYDSQGRGLTSQHGSGASLITISYDDATGNGTVMNALGEQEVYKVSPLRGVSKAMEIDRLATSTTAAATGLRTYDANGYTASATDWNGNLTTYVRDVHGDPTTINEAVGTPQARTTTIVYDFVFVHLPSTVTTQGLTTSYSYDVNEHLLTKTLTDTSTQTVPYSTNGQTRTWTNTWQNFLLASAKTPKGNLTQYAYDSTGALISTTNALLQVTNITQHTGGGYPLVTVDPNNVTTTLTYDGRLRLLTSTVSATNQPSFTTTNTYDPAGNLTSVQLPDNPKLTYGYDTAHRLISITDLFGNATTYTLDALGDITLTKLSNPQGTLRIAQPRRS